MCYVIGNGTRIKTFSGLPCITACLQILPTLSLAFWPVVVDSMHLGLDIEPEQRVRHPVTVRSTVIGAGRVLERIQADLRGLVVETVLRALLQSRSPQPVVILQISSRGIDATVEQIVVHTHTYLKKIYICIYIN
jgi:hypothetical protein